MRDYIRDGENGFLAPVGEPEKMAEAAIRLIDEPPLMQRISSAARETALEHTWERCARDAEAFYRRLLALKKHPLHVC
jgi:glycosyltransferase involved in cell wall biosynthesis